MLPLTKGWSPLNRTEFLGRKGVHIGGDYCTMPEISKVVLFFFVYKSAWTEMSFCFIFYLSTCS